MDIDDGLVGGASGAAMALVISALLVPLRGDVSSAVAALLLVLPVVVGAVVGGRAAGATTAVVSTMCFDFFFTRPYGSLKIASGDDVEAALVLLVLGVVVGTIAVRGRRSSQTAQARQSELTAVYRVAALVVDPAPVAHLVRAAAAELMSLLALERCEFVDVTRASDAGALPKIEQSGSVSVTFRRFVHGGFELPLGAHLPVRGPGGTHGWFVLYAAPGVAVPIERRRAAVVIADLVGTAMEAEADAA